MTIRTNNVPRDILYPHDLSLTELGEFEYLIDANDCDDNEARHTKWNDSGATFFRYRGNMYDFSNFVRIELQSARTSPFCHGVEANSPLLEWGGIQADTFYSGVVVRYIDDESVVVGTYTS